MARPPLNAARRSAPKALRRWPKAPSTLSSPDERRAWERIGVAAMAQGGFTAADLLAAEACAEVEVLFQRAKKAGGTKVTTITSLAKTRLDHYRALGLTTIARRNIGPVDPGDDDPEIDRLRSLLG